MKALIVKQRKDNQKWCINAERIGLSSKEGGFETEGEAEAEAARMLARFQLGLPSKDDIVTELFSVNDAVGLYLEQEKLMQTEPYHQEQIHNLQLLQKIVFEGTAVGKHQMEYLGSKAARISFKNTATRAITDEGQSIDTMERRRKHWGKFLQHAAISGWIDFNPLGKMKLPVKSKVDSRAPRVQKEFVRWLQTAGLTAYTEAYTNSGRTSAAQCKRPRIHPKTLQLMLQLSLTCGCRQGELRAFKWSDYSPNRQMIRVSGAIKHGTQKRGKAKTDQSQDRDIELPSVICQMLDQFRRDTKFAEAEDYIFPCSAGTPLRKNDFTDICEPFRLNCPFVDETGKPLRFVWGDLRHAFASNLIDQLGANWAEVSESMGHTNANFTRKQYGHYIVDEEKQQRKREAAAAILA